MKGDIYEASFVVKTKDGEVSGKVITVFEVNEDIKSGIQEINGIIAQILTESKSKE